MKLTGDRCQCMTCGRYFLTTDDFDHHRTGRYGWKGSRRCLAPAETGMVKTDDGWWRKWNPAAKDGAISAQIDLSEKHLPTI